MTRTGRAERQTSETRIAVVLGLDGEGGFTTRTGVPFFDHMLSQLAKHSGFDLTVEAAGDLEVEPHHVVEDVGITLGQVFHSALGDARGITRFATIHAPMDEALVLAAVDVGGRSYLHYGVEVERQLLGTFSTDLAEEFFRAFVTHAGITLHLVRLHGRNAHHILEAAFKGTGIVLRQATRITGTGIPSTKGRL